MNSRLLWTWGHKLEGNGYLVIVGMQGCRRFPRIVNERPLHVWLRSNGKPQTTSQILECLSPYRHTMWFRSPQFIRDSNIHHMNWYRVLYKYDFAFLWFGGITFHWPSGFCTNPGDLKPLIWLYSYALIGISGNHPTSWNFPRILLRRGAAASTTGSAAKNHPRSSSKVFLIFCTPASPAFNLHPPHALRSKNPSPKPLGIQSARN